MMHHTTPQETGNSGQVKKEIVVEKTVNTWTREVEFSQATVFWVGFTFFAGGTFGTVISLCVLSLLAKLLDFIKEMI